VVPKLKGRTKAFAKALLKAGGCKLGTVKRKTVSKGRNGRVRSQTVKKGTSVPAGTKVGVTLNRRR
jgi:beta-lactam-binding protein with PASTA domain